MSPADILAEIKILSDERAYQQNLLDKGTARFPEKKKARVAEIDAQLTKLRAQLPPAAVVS